MRRPADNDPFALERRRVASAFDAASGQYDAGARVQATVRAELLERLLELRLEPRTILDLGAGTGVATRELKRRFPKALVVAVDLAPGMLEVAARRSSWWRPFRRVVGDAYQLPFRNRAFDLVFSNLMFQWCDNLQDSFAEVRRVLAPTGRLLLSTFGPDTLTELRQSWAAAGDGANHVSRFLDLHDVGDALVRAGLVEPVLDVDRIELRYDAALDLMRDLKSIGARNATVGRSRGLTSRRRLAAVVGAYENHRRNGKLPATYEVVYASAWGSDAAPDDFVARPSNAPGEVHIDVEAIGRSNRPSSPK
ncbi:MAG TPA: malonyl-ACP O-methyltransferase BioC [Steroidobacteraceae bacterium]|nr:malonyl-ACP O-methyltransferase BioC [Steroidobacteraceae bacterium]HRX88368.1 malonyl-ACP O-methyltransferase BioC [Steroidobacteraceae bacterium]